MYAEKSHFCALTALTILKFLKYKNEIKVIKTAALNGFNYALECRDFDLVLIFKEHCDVKVKSIRKLFQVNEKKKKRG